MLMLMSFLWSPNIAALRKVLGLRDWAGLGFRLNAEPENPMSDTLKALSQGTPAVMQARAKHSQPRSLRLARALEL